MKPGEKMPDGTIYAGISPDTGKDMYAAPADAPLSTTFNDAANYAQKLNKDAYLGHDDWRVPSKDELTVIFNNRSAIPGLNVSDTNASWYWSSSPFTHWLAWAQHFSSGVQLNHYKDRPFSVRCVR